jgi:hypothetical protein
MLTKSQIKKVQKYLDENGDAYHFANPGQLGTRVGNVHKYEAGILINGSYCGWANLEKKEFEDIAGTGNEADYKKMDKKIIEEKGEELIELLENIEKE